MRNRQFIKNVLTVLLAFVFLGSAVWAEGAGTVTLYATDGRTADVYENEADMYKALGWYGSYEEVTATLYAPDGRSMVVYKDEVPTYLALGWYGSYEDVTATLYAPDGRSMVVYKDEVPTYLALGWYGSYEDVTATLYAADGRSMVVYKDEVPTYLALGWFADRADTVVTLYDRKGNSIEVYRAERDAYIKLGWFDTAGFDPSRPTVALTFDDGPSIYTGRILDVLEKYGAAATFFVVGQNAASYSSLIAREVNGGMEIGNHTYSHPTLTSLSASQISSQISRTDSAVSGASGRKTTLLRPPYGAHNQTVRSAAGKPVILWSVDTRDWESRNADKVYNHVIQNAKDGDIILMHDLYASTAAAVEKIVPALIGRGFQLVTVSQLAAGKGIALKNGNTYNALR